MLYLALRLNYIDEISFKALLLKSEEIAKILNGLIKSLPLISSSWFLTPNH
jgi:hypothetical protein